LKLLHVAQELPDLIGLSLSVAVLQVQRARHLRMFVNVMAAFGPIPPVAKSLDNLAEIRKSDILRVVQKPLVDLARSHFFSRQCPFIVLEDTPSWETVSIIGGGADGNYPSQYSSSQKHTKGTKRLPQTKVA
jgi:hypothetical protein